MKALFITSWYPTATHPHGLFVQEHAKAVQLYDDVVVLHCAGPDPGMKRLWRLEQETEETLTMGLPTYRVWYRPLPLPPASYLLYLWSVRQAFRQIVARGFRPDVIHAHIYEAGMPAVLIGKLSHMPVVVTEHWSAFPLRYLSRTGKVKAKIAFRLADAVLPVSQALRAGIESHGIRANFRIVPNAVDTTLFRRSSKERAACDATRLLFVGDIKPVKGISYMLQALAQLGNNLKDWKLDIVGTTVGDGPERREYECLVHELALSDKVTFHGLKSKVEVGEFMRQADLLVLPSLWENLPCVVLEAMTAGLPVVSTKIGGIPEIVDASIGVLAPPKDASKLSQALTYAIEHLDEFDRDAIARAAERFSAESVGRTIHSIYEQCLQTSRGR